MGKRPVFPAAAEPERPSGGHDRNCACNACTTALLEVIRKPLLPGAPTDRRGKR